MLAAAPRTPLQTGHPRKHEDGLCRSFAKVLYGDF